MTTKLAYLNALPFEMIILGGEMIFIIDQRLRAQEIKKESKDKGFS